MTSAIDVKEFIKQAKKKSIQPPVRYDMAYVSVAEYASILGVSTDTVYGLCCTGHIEGIIKVGNRWRIPTIKPNAAKISR